MIVHPQLHGERLKLSEIPAKFAQTVFADEEIAAPALVNDVASLNQLGNLFNDLFGFTLGVRCGRIRCVSVILKIPGCCPR